MAFRHTKASVGAQRRRGRGCYGRRAGLQWALRRGGVKGGWHGRRCVMVVCAQARRATRACGWCSSCTPRGITCGRASATWPRRRSWAWTSCLVRVGREGGRTARMTGIVTRTGAARAARGIWRKEGDISVPFVCVLVGGAGVTLVQADVTKGAARLRDAIGDAQAVVCATGERCHSSPPAFRERARTPWRRAAAVGRAATVRCMRRSLFVGQQRCV